MRSMAAIDGLKAIPGIVVMLAIMIGRGVAAL
jgi:hypothetical protein